MHLIADLVVLAGPVLAVVFPLSTIEPQIVPSSASTSLSTPTPVSSTVSLSAFTTRIASMSHMTISLGPKKGSITISLGDNKSNNNNITTTITNNNETSSSSVTSTTWHHGHMGPLRHPANSSGIQQEDHLDIPPKGYHFTVLNSDCPCDRFKHRFCTYFKREAPESGRCYPITKPSRSMHIFDPLVALNNPLLCYAYEDHECKGRESQQAMFTDNTMCREPGNELNPFLYNSFRCMHRTY